MSAVNDRQVLETFETALDVSPDRRSAWLAKHCLHDPRLHERVTRLLECHRQAQAFLDCPTTDEPERSAPLPSQFGRYEVILRREEADSARCFSHEIPNCNAM